MARKGGNPDLVKYQWKKGDTPNPGGRRPIPEEVKRALIEATPEATRVLLDLLRSDNEKIRIQAVQVIYDRAYGKAAATVDVKVHDVGALHLQLLEEIRERRQERIGQAIDITPKEEGHTDKVMEYEPPKSND
jgi:hypothetical protein